MSAEWSDARAATVDHRRGRVDAVRMIPVRSESRQLPVADATIGIISRLLGYVSALMVVAIMVLVVADVVMRNVVGSSIGATVGYAEILLVGSVYLALAHARRSDSHISVDLVTSRLGERTAAMVEGAGVLLALVLLAMTSVVSIEQAMDSIAQGEYRIGVERIPVWPGRVAVAVGWSALTLELLRDAVVLGCRIVGIGFRGAVPGAPVEGGGL